MKTKFFCCRSEIVYIYGQVKINGKVLALLSCTFSVKTTCVIDAKASFWLVL